MSYSHTQRRKIVKRFKEKYGDKWYPRFREHISAIVAERLGPPIGTLEEIMRIRKELKDERTHIARQCRYSVLTIWIDGDICSEAKNCLNKLCPFRKKVKVNEKKGENS